MRTSTKQAFAFWLREPGVGEIRPVPVREPATGEVLVRTLCSGVSRGTEALVFRGGVPHSEYDTMRAPFQEGDFPGPVKYGYLSEAAARRARRVRLPHLDEQAELADVNTTTAALAKVIADRIADHIHAGAPGASARGIATVAVMLRESPVASAGYERPM